MSLRDRKKAETRAALTWAALRLTVERGFGGVRVEEIAAAAGVSPRTFNNYFSSKAEALAARHLDRCLGIAEELRAAPADEPLWDALTRAALARFGPDATAAADPTSIRSAARWAEGVRVMLAEPAVQGEMLRAAARAEAEIAAAVAERTGTDAERDLYPALVAAAVLAAANTAVQYGLRRNELSSVREPLAEALARLRAGLPVPVPVPDSRTEAHDTNGES
jgi:AcrR family transcriptional regulator